MRIVSVMAFLALYVSFTTLCFFISSILQAMYDSFCADAIDAPIHALCNQIKTKKTMSD